MSYKYKNKATQLENTTNNKFDEFIQNAKSSKVSVADFFNFMSPEWEYVHKPTETRIKQKFVEIIFYKKGMQEPHLQLQLNKFFLCANSILDKKEDIRKATDDLFESIESQPHEESQPDEEYQHLILNNSIQAGDLTHEIKVSKYQLTFKLFYKGTCITVILPYYNKKKEFLLSLCKIQFNQCLDELKKKPRNNADAELIKLLLEGIIKKTETAQSFETIEVQKQEKTIILYERFYSDAEHEQVRDFFTLLKQHITAQEITKNEADLLFQPVKSSKETTTTTNTRSSIRSRGPSIRRHSIRRSDNSKSKQHNTPRGAASADQTDGNGNNSGYQTPTNTHVHGDPNTKNYYLQPVDAGKTTGNASDVSSPNSGETGGRVSSNPSLFGKSLSTASSNPPNLEKTPSDSSKPSITGSLLRSFWKKQRSKNSQRGVYVLPHRLQD